MTHAPLVAILLTGLVGCSSATGSSRVCTALFAQSTVSIVDSAARLVDNAAITTTLVRTGTVLSVTSATPLLPGIYVIIDDSSVRLLRTQGDTISVRAARASGSVTATYFFDVPDGCHIHKLSGPDTLVLP